MFGPEDPIDLVLEAERLGYDSVWTAEAYGSDAVSYLSWMGAHPRIKLATRIIQISARTPACVAMTAMTIDHLSGGGSCWARRLRATGRRGLVRAAVSAADGAHARVRRRRAADAQARRADDLRG
jgi:hypothetical protein